MRAGRLLAQRRRLTIRTIMIATSSTWVVLGVKVAGWPKMDCRAGQHEEVGWGFRTGARPQLSAFCTHNNAHKHCSQAPSLYSQQMRIADRMHEAAHLAEGEQLAQRRLDLLPHRVGAAGQHQAGKQCVARLQVGGEGARSLTNTTNAGWHCSALQAAYDGREPCGVAGDAINGPQKQARTPSPACTHLELHQRDDGHEDVDGREEEGQGSERHGCKGGMGRARKGWQRRQAGGKPAAVAAAAVAVGRCTRLASYRGACTDLRRACR